VHTLKQAWQRARARIANTFKPGSHPSSGSLVAEDDITSVIREHQNLAAELHRFRTESEQNGSEAIREIGTLEAAYQEARSASVGQAKQLADLERRIVELEAERHQSLERVKSIETSLADTASRVETVDNQARVSHARSREQEKEFGDSLSLAIARQNTTDTRLEELRHTSLQQVTAIETSLADTSQQVMAIETSLADTSQQVMAIETSLADTSQQVMAIETTLANPSIRLVTVDGRIRAQEQKLDLEHQLYLHTVQEIQSQVRSQDQRLNWTMMAAIFAMLLGSVAGGILIWDVQKNAKILGGISMEMERLGASVAQSRIMGHPAGADESAGLPDFSDSEYRNDPEDQRVVGGLPLSGP
jgi:predicted  nucleic acid-binding Zn-ribbon protein